MLVLVLSLVLVLVLACARPGSKWRLERLLECRTLIGAERNCGRLN